MSPETNAWGATQPAVSRRVGVFGGIVRCVYCGARCASYHLACYKCADLPTLDTRYVLSARTGTGPR